MENDVLDYLEELGCPTAFTEETLSVAVTEGLKSPEYSSVVAWLAKELQTLCKLDECINPITDPNDTSEFLLETSSFLKELQCPYPSLIDGPVTGRLTDKTNRLLLLNFLTTELLAARISHAGEEETNAVQEESSTAADLKDMLICLGFSKPPASITPAMLFGRVGEKIKELTAQRNVVIGKPLFQGVLTEKQWKQLSSIQTELHEDYRMRREMLLKRLDVTIQSFHWSDRLKGKEDELAKKYQAKRQMLSAEPSVKLHNLLAAREDLAIMEKTSSASVRKNTKSAINGVVIGRVPDRGGRPSETAPPPPEMPSWQKRTEGGGGGGGGRGGGYRGSGRGGGRGSGGNHRVQGAGWNQDNSRGDNYRGHRGGGRGGWNRGGGRGYDAAGSYGQQYQNYH